MFGLSFGHLLIVGVVAVLLFGERLPEVSRKVGRMFIEFKKNVSSVQEAIMSSTGDIYRTTNDAFRSASSSYNTSSYSTPSSNSSSSSSSRYDTDDREEATAPKFEPPPTEPRVVESQAEVARLPSSTTTDG